MIKKPDFYMTNHVSYQLEMGGKVWITKGYFQPVNPYMDVCCQKVNCQYDEHAFTRPYNVATLESIAISNLLYWLQQVARHDHAYCKIKSPLIRILQALTHIDLPEHFKISKIVSHFKYFVSVENKSIKKHTCLTMFGCREQEGSITQPVNSYSKIKQTVVKINYVCVRFGDKVFLPRRDCPSVPVGVVFPYKNSSADIICFGNEQYPPMIAVNNLVPLYSYLKSSKTFKCCDTNFNHVRHFTQVGLTCH